MGNLQETWPYRVRGIINRWDVSTWYTGFKYVTLVTKAGERFLTSSLHSEMRLSNASQRLGD